MRTLARPRALTPAFYGCYDWHSSVHAHWLLARLARLYPDAPFANPARAALDRSLGDANLAGELRYFQTPGRASFERPYGLAWLLQLAAELRAWDDPQAKRWAASLAPLESEVAQRLQTWLPKLRYPIRVGEHSQTAFALGLVHDWAVRAGDENMRRLVEDRARFYYLGDVSCPLGTNRPARISCPPASPRRTSLRRILAPAAFADCCTSSCP